MNLDGRISDVLRRAGDTVDPDLRESLVWVRRKAARRASRRRLALVGAVAVTAAAMVVLAQQLGFGGSRSGIGPADDASRGPVPNPFRVVRTHTASSLGLEHVLGMAVAPDGHLYVTDSSQTVAELTRDGEVLRRWGGPGAGTGRFRMTTGSIAVGDDGRVYVVDTGNFRVQVFSPRGEFIRTVGRFGTGPGRFLWPFDVAVDSVGHLYVADDRAATLTKLSPAGNQMWRVGGDEETAATLVGHEHLGQVLPDGRLVTANDDAGLVVYVDPAGHPSDAFGSAASGAHELGRFPARGMFPGGACDAMVGDGGLVFVTSCQDPTSPRHLTRVFDSSRRLVGEWPDNPLSRSPRPGPAHRAYAVTYDGSVVQLEVSLP